jgi:glyoxylase-like metal-dependent hydrolase (beta-lactamase superfamily II)
VVDVRTPSAVANGRIEPVSPDRFRNILGSRILASRSLAELGLDPDARTVVVCGHGNSSRTAAQHLSNLGCQATSLRDGMAGWMSLVIPRELPVPYSLDAFVQFDRVGKGSLGYLLVSNGEAIIVDPPRDFSAYLRVARLNGARVVGVVDTHVHADYISGAPTLAHRLGVPYYLHPADSIYPYDGNLGRLEFLSVSDGDTIPFGRSQLCGEHTPGHTEGSMTYVIDDHAALTGDFVFVASVGRPDLAGKTTEWAKELWRSLNAARQRWPAGLGIYPAHYAAQEERVKDGTVCALFGDLPTLNEAFAFTSEDAFTAWVAKRAAPPPDAYRKIKAVNVGLLGVDDTGAEELELGRNQCALPG